VVVAVALSHKPSGARVQLDIRLTPATRIDIKAGGLFTAAFHNQGEVAA